MFKSSKLAKTYECWMKHPYQTSPTWKINTFALKYVGWNSNIIQHEFFLLFRNFMNLLHKFSSYSLTREKQVAISFRLKQLIPISTKNTLIYTKFEHFYQNLLNNIKDLPEANLSRIKTKMRNIKDKSATKT